MFWPIAVFPVTLSVYFTPFGHLRQLVFYRQQESRCLQRLFATHRACLVENVSLRFFGTFFRAIQIKRINKVTE